MTVYNLIDLSGQRFHWLTVIERASNNKGGKARWLCRCDCGKTTIVQSACLRTGHTKSCGCYGITHSIIHGEAKHGQRTKEYSAWRTMKDRCLNPRNSRYDSYGGRGIRVCNRWLHNYENFLFDMGRSPEGLTMERIDNNGNYEPGNCKWATQKEQACNRRDNVYIEHNGKVRVKSSWIRKLKITHSKWDYWQKKMGLTHGEVLRYLIGKEVSI